MSTNLERYIGRTSVQRQVKGEIQRVVARVQVAEAKMAASREVGTYGAASVTHLRNVLREIEQYNVDAAPEAAVIVRIANSSIIAAALEFEAGL